MKKIINIVLALLLSVALVGNIALFIVSNTILNKEYIVAQLDKNEFYSRIDTDLKNKLENYTYQSGLPKEVFENLYEEDDIKEYVLHIVDCIYGDSSLKQENVPQIEEKLSDNITIYLKENNVSMTKEIENNIKEFKKIVVNAWNDSFSVPTEKISGIYNVANKFSDVISKILIVALILLIVIVIIVNVANMAEGLNYIMISLFVSGILLRLVPWVVNSNINVENILIWSQSISDFAKQIIFDVFDKLNSYGIMLIFIGIVGIVASNYWKVKRRIDD